MGTIRNAVFISIMILSLISGLWLESGSPRVVSNPDEEEAFHLMVKATDIIKEAKLARQIKIDPITDPNATGLIGPASSSITSTEGNLISKRTVTNPQVAGSLVNWFKDKGARRGDLLWIHSSASYPGFVIAVLSAVKALELDYVLITSLASSNYGAADEEFTWLDMEEALYREGWIEQRSSACSIGSGEDRGLGLSPRGLAKVKSVILRADLPLLKGESLDEMIDLKLKTYSTVSHQRKPILFVNIGGNQSAFGRFGTDAILGYIPPFSWAAPKQGYGLVQKLNAEGLQVINLQNGLDFASSRCLKIDPLPLPGSYDIYTVAPPSKAGGVFCFNALLLVGGAIVNRKLFLERMR